MAQLKHQEDIRYQDGIAHAIRADTLADVLERILDKGIVIAGDITVYRADVELLTIKIRLLLASVDRAMEMGINWRESDPDLLLRARDLAEENQKLKEQLERLEAKLEAESWLRKTRTRKATTSRSRH